MNVGTVPVPVLLHNVGERWHRERNHVNAVPYRKHTHTHTPFDFDSLFVLVHPCQVFGERGVHSRSAVGTNALPMNVPVEIEAIVEFANKKKRDDDWTVIKRP